MIPYVDLLGAPFKYRGSSVDEGFDCFTLVSEMLVRSGQKPMLPYAYSDTPEFTMLHKMIHEEKDLFDEVRTPEVGSIVLIAFGKFVCHMGFVVSQNMFIHIMEKTSVTVERLDAPYWQKKIRGYYKWKKTN